MIAPSFVAVLVSEGGHRIEFTYEPYPRYDVLLLVGALALALLFAGPGFLRSRKGRSEAVGDVPTDEVLPQAEEL
jgi:hypothetical protein